MQLADTVYRDYLPSGISYRGIFLFTEQYLLSSDTPCIYRRTTSHADRWLSKTLVGLVPGCLRGLRSNELPVEYYFIRFPNHVDRGYTVYTDTYRNICVHHFLAASRSRVVAWLDSDTDRTPATNTCELWDPRWLVERRYDRGGVGVCALKILHVVTRQGARARTRQDSLNSLDDTPPRLRKGYTVTSWSGIVSDWSVQ